MTRNPYPKGTYILFRQSGQERSGCVVRTWTNKLADATHPGRWYEIDGGDRRPSMSARVYHKDVIGLDPLPPDRFDPGKAGH